MYSNTISYIAFEPVGLTSPLSSSTAQSAPCRSAPCTFNQHRLFTPLILPETGADVRRDLGVSISGAFSMGMGMVTVQHTDRYL